MKTRKRITIEEEYSMAIDETDSDVIELQKAFMEQTYISRDMKQYIVSDCTLEFLNGYVVYTFKLEWNGYE